MQRDPTGSTLISPLMHGYSAGTCGYCTPPGSRSKKMSSKKYGMSAESMSPQFYQDLIDRGWRRSGSYVYHPDMARTCCPQYTIRLDAQAYKPSKKHRQVVNRFNRFLEGGDETGENSPRKIGNCDMNGTSAQGGPAKKTNGSTGKDKGKDKGKGKAAPWDFMAELRKYEVGFGQEGKHRFETELALASDDQERYDLYLRYQVAVHKDPPGRVSKRGFEGFLVDSPLSRVPIKYDQGQDLSRLPATYGIHHLLYRIDGKLVGISVIDILPYCVSSVYFLWDPDYAWASLGKLSAMREIALARDIRAAGAKDMGWVYMGYWIPDCQKMRYKGEYEPSYILDPVGNEVRLTLTDRQASNTFRLLTPALDKQLLTETTGKKQSTKSPDNSTSSDDNNSDDSESDEDEDMDEIPSPPPPGCLDPKSIPASVINGLAINIPAGMFHPGGTARVDEMSWRGSKGAVMKSIRELYAAVGGDLMASAGMAKGMIGDKAVLFFG